MQKKSFKKRGKKDQNVKKHQQVKKIVSKVKKI